MDRLHGALDDTSLSRVRSPVLMGGLPNSTLDAILTLQLGVAWAGEGDQAMGLMRLGWWRGVLVDPDGGEDLFRHLTPSSARWSVFEAVREVARRADEAARLRDADADRLRTLFYFGPEDDEALDERLWELKHTTTEPLDALRDLRLVIQTNFDPSRLRAFISHDTPVEFKVVPTGRQLVGPPPSPELRARKLAAALADPRSFPSTYPLPHYRLPERAAP